MTWTLSFGALTAGLRARSDRSSETAAGLWAAETRNLLGRQSLGGMVLHGAAVVATDHLGLELQAVLFARQADGWLTTGAVLGVLSAWGLALIEVLRSIFTRRGVPTDLAMSASSTAVVVGGAVHGWLLGSNTQNTAAMVVFALSSLVPLASAAVGFTTLLADNDPLPPAAPALTVTPVEAAEFSQTSTSSLPSQEFPPSQEFTAPITPPLSAPVTLSRPIDPPSKPRPRPQIASAREVPPAGLDVDHQRPFRHEPGGKGPSRTHQPC